MALWGKWLIVDKYICPASIHFWAVSNHPFAILKMITANITCKQI